MPCLELQSSQNSALACLRLVWFIWSWATSFFSGTVTPAAALVVDRQLFQHLLSCIMIFYRVVCVCAKSAHNMKTCACGPENVFRDVDRANRHLHRILRADGCMRSVLRISRGGKGHWAKRWPVAEATRSGATEKRKLVAHTHMRCIYMPK